MTQTPTQLVAANVRAETARLRISQARMAEAMGLTQQAVSRRLNGLVPFGIDELYIVADILDTTPAALMQLPKSTVPA